MLDFNGKITFTRFTNSVVSSWASGSPTIIQPSEPAFLEVTASGITAGTLLLGGLDENGIALSEYLSFASSSTAITLNQYKSVTALTPSWSSYLININAVNIQGIPIQRSLTYGPFLCTIGMQNSYIAEDEVGTSGNLMGLAWRVAILAFEPRNGDHATLNNGIAGIVSDVSRILIPNFPKGWWFVVSQNPG